MTQRTENRLALRVTPMVFCAIFLLGVWSEPIDFLGVGPHWFPRVSFAAAAASMATSAAWPTEHTRFAALALGTWACLGRGLTLLIEGQELVPRKSEIIGGSIWMACSYFVLFAWIISVPLARWHHEQR